MMCKNPWCVWLVQLGVNTEMIQSSTNLSNLQMWMFSPFKTVKWIFFLFYGHDLAFMNWKTNFWDTNQ